MAVNYEYYRCFYYVAKYRNLTQAAAAMNSSQPNMTRVIHNLEHDLGCRLLIRSNRGVALTEEGARLYQHVAAAFEELRLGEEELIRSGGIQEGTLHIGTSETALHILLLKVLWEFHQAYPGVRLKIRNFTTPQAINALSRGEIDLAVTTTPVGPLRPYLKRMDLKSFQDILIGGRQFAELAKQPLQLADLSRYPLISLARDTRTFAFYSQIYMSHDLELDPDIEVATTDLILPMVKNGLGLGFLPQAFAEEALESGSVVQLRLLDPIPGRHICMVWDSHGGLGDPARILRQMLCDCSDRE